MENKRKIKGAHISRLVFPTLALILLLQLLIIIFSSLINSYSNELSKKTKRQTDVSNMITSILASSSKLSDTAITFVHSPTIPVGPTGYKLNTGPLEPYYSQIILEKADPDYIDNELKKYSLKQEIMDIIDEVIEEYRFTINHQSHALHLVYHALKDDTGITDEDKQLLDNVIEAFKEQNYINDEEYIARSIKEFLALKSLSIKELTYKLLQKGVNRKVLDNYIYENREMLVNYEVESAKKLITKKALKMEVEDIKKYLFQKGYMSETVSIAIDEILDN